MRKSDLRENYPFGMFAEPRRRFGREVDPEAVKTKLKLARGLSVSVTVAPDGSVPRSGGKLNRAHHRR